MKRPKITVIGSINMDMVTKADLTPEQGETILGTDFQMIPGGKGANQAVAAARLGAEVTMIGCVGDDAFSDVALLNLNTEGVATSGVKRVADTPTGVANIILTEEDNRIIVIPGANHALTADDVLCNEETIINSDLIMMQLEIPLDTVAAVVEMAAALGIPVLLNPAPVQKLSMDLLERVTFLTPNETEEQALALPEHFRDKLIVTLGEKGAAYMADGQAQRVPGNSVKVVDTTGAGDTFNGALAVQVARGEKLEGAIHFANAAAALSVTAFGAQAGMPEEKDVLNFLDFQDE